MSKILLLAKFLKEMKELNSSITNLGEFFTPRNGNLKAMLGNVYTATITQLGTLLKAVAERYDCSITFSTSMGGEERKTRKRASSIILFRYLINISIVQSVPKQLNFQK